MINQKAREIFYFKVPVFLADLTIHLVTLYLLLVSATLEQINYRESDLLHTHRNGIYTLLTLSFCVSISLIGLHLHERRIKALLVVWRALMQTATTYVLFTVLLVMTFKIVPRQLLTFELLITMIVISICHYLMNKGVRLLRQLGRNTRNVVIVGADETAKRIYKELIYGQVFTGYRIKGFFTSLDLDLPEGARLLGKVDDCYGWLMSHKMDEVYCSLPPATCSREINKIIRVCNENFADFYFVPNMEGYPHRSMKISQFGNVNVISLREEPLNTPWGKLLKRTFDIFASSLFLCTVFPFVYLFVWMGNVLTGSKGPVFFCQKRTGYNGKSFKIFKFRSMKVNADADKLQATENDPRKTKFGDFLRRSSIDELPQFINVLKGDMSIIGPRPHMEFHTEKYSALISDYMVRHLAKPGITGWAQINGCRGETKTVEEMKDRVEHDIWYIEHWTPLLDMEIFFKTIWQCLPGRDKQAY